MQYKPCSKCGAMNSGTSKHRPVEAEGIAWCGHCGTKLVYTPAQVRFYFRVFPEGDVIALWHSPDDRPGLMSSYMHVGQHGDASKELLTELRKATTGERVLLTHELASIGYRVLDGDEWDQLAFPC